MMYQKKSCTDSVQDGVDIYTPANPPTDKRANFFASFWHFAFSQHRMLALLLPLTHAASNVAGALQKRQVSFCHSDFA